MHIVIIVTICPVPGGMHAVTNASSGHGLRIHQLFTRACSRFTQSSSDHSEGQLQGSLTTIGLILDSNYSPRLAGDSLATIRSTKLG